MHVHLEREIGGRGGGEKERGRNGCKADFNRWVKVQKYGQQAWLHTKGST